MQVLAERRAVIGFPNQEKMEGIRSEFAYLRRILPLNSAFHVIFQVFLLYTRELLTSSKSRLSIHSTFFKSEISSESVPKAYLWT